MLGNKGEIETMGTWIDAPPHYPRDIFEIKLKTELIFMKISFAPISLLFWIGRK